MPSLEFGIGDFLRGDILEPQRPHLGLEEILKPKINIIFLSIESFGLQIHDKQGLEN